MGENKRKSGGFKDQRQCMECGEWVYRSARIPDDAVFCMVCDYTGSKRDAAMGGVIEVLVL